MRITTAVRGRRSGPTLGGSWRLSSAGGRVFTLGIPTGIETKRLRRGSGSSLKRWRLAAWQRCCAAAQSTCRKSTGGISSHTRSAPSRWPSKPAPMPPFLTPYPNPYGPNRPNRSKHMSSRIPNIVFEPSAGSGKPFGTPG